MVDELENGLSELKLKLKVIVDNNETFTRNF